MLDMSKLIDRWGVPLKYQIVKGGWVRGIWQEEAEEWVETHEPVLPAVHNLSATAKGGDNLVPTEFGQKREGRLLWYSLQKVPLHTRVEHKGTLYKVISVDDYTEYSNVCAYYLDEEE